MQWENILESLEPLRIKFRQSYKCINQNRSIKPETVSKHIQILIETFNTIRATLHRQYDRYSTPHKEEANGIFHGFRDQLIKVFHKHNVNIKVPLTLSCEIDIEVTETDESETEESETDKITKTAGNSKETKGGIETTNMPRTEDDVMDKATKIVPVFDGSVSELQSFLDALTLMDRIKETHEMVAIDVIKTKLKGHARNIITNENTIQAIKDKLQSSVQGESSELLCSKLMNIKQQSKSATTYAEEIQEIAKKLGGAYIREGYPQNIVEKLIRQNAAKAISRNATSDEVKLIIKTGNFNTLNEVVSKFIEASTEASVSNSSVFYFKRRGSGNQNYRNIGFNNRGRGREGRRNNNSRNYNNNRYNGQRRGQHDNNGNQPNHQRNRGWIRLAQEVSENETSPQDAGGYTRN